MFFLIEVRPGPNVEFFQYYTEEIEANTSQDAINRVQRANRGCQVRCCASYTNSGDPRSGSGDTMSPLAVIGILGLAGIVWLYVEFPFVMIPLTVVGIGLWIYSFFSNDEE